jgi:hypothetical protein
MRVYGKRREGWRDVVIGTSRTARRKGGSTCWFQKVEAKVSREAEMGRDA